MTARTRTLPLPLTGTWRDGLDPNTFTSSHRCTNSRAAINEAVWLHTGLIVDTDGQHYTPTGQPDPDIRKDIP
jgi:hypothetical protein